MVGGDWTLIGTDGDSFSSQNLGSSYYLIYFGYTKSPDICPSTLYYLSSVYRIIRNLPEGAYLKLKIVFASIDPERDTPKVLKEYLHHFGKQIIGVTASSSDDIELKECMKKFKIQTRKVVKTGVIDKTKYDIDHTTRVFLMDPNNKYLLHLNPSLTEQQTAKAIVTKIVENEHRREKSSMVTGI
jgi:cytochrome oxidase Cu insertion factor (SCO1/SenC/PrrC family)